MFLAASSLIGTIAMPITAWAWPDHPIPSARTQDHVNPHAAALVEFQARLQKYLDLRKSLGDKLKPLSPTSDPSELAARQASLASALRAARQGAKPGDLIVPAVATQIRTTTNDYFRTRSQSTKEAVFEEVPENLRPAINKTMPDSAALATVPPILLNNLPRLPDNLQFRFVGRDIVLIDGDTRLMLDYIRGALPAH